MARFLIVAGAILIVAGIAWPLLARLGLGHLPGDIHIRRGNTDVYFPVATCVLASLVLTLLLWLLRSRR